MTTEMSLHGRSTRRAWRLVHGTYKAGGDKRGTRGKRCRQSRLARHSGTRAWRAPAGDVASSRSTHEGCNTVGCIGVAKACLEDRSMICRKLAGPSPPPTNGRPSTLQHAHRLKIGGEFDGTMQSSLLSRQSKHPEIAVCATGCEALLFSRGPLSYPRTLLVPVGCTSRTIDLR
jgi:hypothetical protein